MAELFEMKEEEERVILAAVETGDGDGARLSLKELEELASTAGAVTVGTVIQNRENIHPGTYLGKGKLEELKEMILGAPGHRHHLRRRAFAGTA